MNKQLNTKSLSQRVAEWIQEVNGRETAAQPLRWVDGRYHVAAGLAHVWNVNHSNHLTTQQMAGALTEIRDNPDEYPVDIDYKVGSDGKGRWQPYKGVFAD